ncbi:MAG TPA: hypothetical protein VFN10_20640 [Thermoanaerobaculia bacterium]|nr:hypothetical protein [Thermoanaerobaculia bacterium]
MRKWWLWLIAVVLVVAVIWAVKVFVFVDKTLTTAVKDLKDQKSMIGKIKDEAAAAGRTPESLAAADEDYYADMDYGVTKNPNAVYDTLKEYLQPTATPADAVRAAVIGRNNWVVWTAGNDRLWNELTTRSVGNLDLLKTVSNHPRLKWNRDQRWKWYGIVNEPCYKINTGADGKPAGRPDRFGLYLDARDNTDPRCATPDPFENEQKYPGVKTGARGDRPNFPAGSYYGYATGVVGLRLFPNPQFDAAAEKNWNAEKYYTDPSYYNNPKLIKPYRVGMSCGFCHVGPNPTRPPKDPEHPQWAELNSNPGAQWFWISRVFMFDQDTQSFVWQLFNTSRPGALDTSLVSSDQINNPRTMNAIYNLHARLGIGKAWGYEELGGGSKNNAQFNDYAGDGKPLRADSLLTQIYDKPNVVRTTHVLKDGSDAVGALGALNRVYVNIGLDSEEWLLHFFPLIGGGATKLTRISPIEITAMRENSTYWKANEAQTPYVALFFLAASPPDDLIKAPGGQAHIAKDVGLIPRGKQVFADRCARCHSSKQPPEVLSRFFQAGTAGPDYLKHWNDYWQYTKTPQYKAAIAQIVNAPDFLTDNFLSTEFRVPSSLLETNLCSPLATNAIRNDIWDNFSSESYKQLPSVGTMKVIDPYTGAESNYAMPAGGRGYTRPASLVSLWSTAPYLQNNTLGSNHDDATYHDNGKGKYYNLDRSVKFYDDPGVEHRVASFEDGITQLLWPEKRAGNTMFKTASGKMAPGWIDKTTQRSWLNVMPGYLPKAISDKLPPQMMNHGNPNRPPQPGLNIGPIPSGTPVNLLSNMNLTETDKVIDSVVHLGLDLLTVNPNASDEELNKHFANAKAPLLAVCKCPDFVVNRGHYFGTDFLPASEGEPGLSDADKKALIAFLRTF